MIVVAPAQYGTTPLAVDRSVTYRPANGYVGAGSFSCTVSDE